MDGKGYHFRYDIKLFNENKPPEGRGVEDGQIKGWGLRGTNF